MSQDSGKREASNLVNEHWDLITRVADELLAKRALTGEEVEALVSTYEEVRQKFEEVRKKFGLTPQELEIVSAVVAGCSNKEIADYCKIGEDTVKVHHGNIFDKVGVSSRLELALLP